MAGEIIYVTIDETVTEVVDVTVNNLRGPTGLTGAPGPSSVAINDADTNLTQTWSSTKINTEITDAVDAVDTSGFATHLIDPVDAHDASAISVLDAGGNYTSDNVETALAEVKTLIDAGGIGTALVIAQDTQPDPLVPNTIWVDTTDLTTYLIYDDGTSIEPVQIATPFGVEGPEGPEGGGSGGFTYIQSLSVDGAPVLPSVGDTWFDLDSSNSYLRYDNGGTPTWMQTGSTSVGINAIDGGIAATF